MRGWHEHGPASGASGGQQKSIASEAIWQSLTERNLTSGLYRYDTPDSMAEQAPLGKKAELLAHLFATKVRGALVWIKDIVGTRSTPEWHTASADSSATVFGDMVAARLASERRAWKDIAQYSYLGQLASALCLALRPPRQDKWFIALGSVGIAVLLWPADLECRQGQPKVLRPSTDGHTEATVIFEFQTWQALTFEWISPLGQVTRRLRAPRDVSEFPCLVALVCTGPAPLLELAAQNAFWGAHGSAVRESALAGLGDRTCC